MENHRKVKLKEVVRLRGLYTILTNERGFEISRDNKLLISDYEIYGEH